MERVSMSRCTCLSFRTQLAVSRPTHASHPSPSFQSWQGNPNPRCGRQPTQTQAFDKLKSMAELLGGPPRKPEEPDNVIEAEFDQEDEEEDEGNMVRIDSETRGIAGEGAFGPLAVLLVGFLPEDVDAFHELMEEMEAEMVKVIPCTKAMLSGTLKEALEVEVVPEYEQPPLGQRRALVLSGMYGSEVIDVVTSYREAGLPPAVFAAAVPNNYDRVVSGLIQEVYADHNAMKQREAQRQAAAGEES